MSPPRSSGRAGGRSAAGRSAKPVGRSSGKPVGRSSGKPVGRSSGKPVGRSGGKPVGRTGGKAAAGRATTAGSRGGTKGAGGRTSGGPSSRSGGWGTSAASGRGASARGTATRGPAAPGTPRTGTTRRAGPGAAPRRGAARGDRPTWERDEAPARSGRGPRPAERGRSRVGGGDRERRGPRHEAQGLGGDQVEGRQAVRELLAAGRREVRDVWIADGLDPSTEIDDIERLARRRRTRVLAVPRGRMLTEARTDNPQGVLAHAQPLEEDDLDELCRRRGSRPPFLLVLDGVTDPQNVGALLRSAECAGVTGVVLPRHRAAHVTPTVTKVASGAVEHLAFAVVPGIPNALARMTELDVHVLGLDAVADQSVFEVELEAAAPLALVMGAEHRGLSALTRRRCASLAAIPQFGTIPSLNVAAAGAVACFEIARRRSG